jgi:thiol:disulfide interchange protein DsbD
MTRDRFRSCKFAGMRLCAAAVLLSALAAGPRDASARQEAPARLQSIAAQGMVPKGIANVQWYVSRDPVPRNSNFEIAVVAEIPPAYHMNAHKVSDEFLIPTTLTADLPDGIHQSDIVYPPGKLQKFSFSTTPLNVYQGKVTILMKLAAAADAKTGPLEIPFTLRYQACDESTCFPPVRVPLRALVKLAEAGTPSRPSHPEIFAKQ